MSSCSFAASFRTMLRGNIPMTVLPLLQQMTSSWDGDVSNRTANRVVDAKTYQPSEVPTRDSKAARVKSDFFIVREEVFVARESKLPPA